MPPLGVLCGEAVLSTCGIGGSFLVFLGLLHSNGERLISSSVRVWVSVAEGHLSRCHEPGGSSLILAGESFPILAGGSSVCAQGLLLCDNIGLL